MYPKKLYVHAFSKFPPHQNSYVHLLLTCSTSLAICVCLALCVCVCMSYKTKQFTTVFTRWFTVVNTISYLSKPKFTYVNVYIYKILLHWQQIKLMRIVKVHYNSVIETYKLESPTNDSLPKFWWWFTVVDTVSYPSKPRFTYMNVYIYCRNASIVGVYCTCNWCGCWTCREVRFLARWTSQQLRMSN